MTIEDNQRQSLLRDFKYNRPLAHKYLFSHRHKDETPAFHDEMCALLYSDHPRVAMMAFRGAAKSTWLEEYVLLSALFRETVFPLIIGPKWESACERLAPIRNELENNELLIDLFGDQKASPWSMDELGLANGAKIQAIGAGQSMRGKKHNDERPDLAAIDDLEDEESVNTEESRRKIDRWLTGTLLPALHPTNGKVRFIGTAIHPKSLIFKKCQDPEWSSRVFPVKYLDVLTGQEHSTWPARFPLAWIKKLEQDYINSGNYIEFQQEYLCVAEDIAGKPFQARMIRVEPVPIAHMPTFAMIDPARTVKARSARTGYAVWSWLGNKLIVHKAEGHFHQPSDMIKAAREIDAEFKPVHIGVEADGLEEFLMEPFRSDMIANGSMPIIPVRAPRDKIQFIKGLQSFYMAGDVTHVKHLPDLESELLQFPTGRIDVPNALAYALRMRVGRPVYEDFTGRHIAAILEPRTNLPLYLCVSSRSALTAGVLVQYIDGTLKVYHDWVYNEPPAECFGRLIREAILIGGQVKVGIPAEQMDQYTNTGLPAAVKKENIQPIRTAFAAKSEGQLREWLRKQVRGETAVLVNEQARWTINALSGGYARKLDKKGQLEDQPVDNQYRVLSEALESFVGWFDAQQPNDTDENLRYARTNDGRRYISMRPNA